MPKNESRDDGFYFVKYAICGESWAIAEWSCPQWNVIGYECYFNDDDFDVIGEMVTMPEDE